MTVIPHTVTCQRSFIVSSYSVAAFLVIISYKGRGGIKCTVQHMSLLYPHQFSKRKDILCSGELTHPPYWKFCQKFTFIVGGSWVGGSKTNMYNFCIYILSTIWAINPKFNFISVLVLLYGNCWLVRRRTKGLTRWPWRTVSASTSWHYPFHPLALHTSEDYLNVSFHVICDT